MKTWNRFFFRGISALAILFLVTAFAANASAQYALLMPKQTFSTNALPSGWSCGDWGSEDVNQGIPYWFWNSTNPSGTGGCAMDDIWDYNPDAITTPTVNASMYTAPGDSVWVDFDFFWEYSGNDYDYQYYYGYTLDEFEIDANSDVLVSGTTDQLYTYYNTNDYNYDVAQSSSSAWQHYHLLIPVEDRNSELQINFLSNYDEYGGPGLTDAAITNVTITAYPPPPVPELSLTPKTLSFGTATPNGPVTLYANVQNVGALPLSISSTSFGGANASYYSVVSGPSEGTLIQPDSSVQYGIQFQPFSNGVLTGTFTVVTDGQDSGTQTINLTGIGAVPDVSYSSNRMFQGVNIELTHTSAVQYLYVNSTGHGPLTVNSVSFYGLDERDYNIVYQPDGPISPGGVDSIGVQFTPSVEGLPDAHMVINSTGINNPSDTVLMYGVGILPHLAIDSAKSWPLPTTVNFDSVQLGSSSCLTVQLTNPGSDTVAIEQNYFESADPDFTLTPLTGRDTLIPPGGSQIITVCFSPVQQGTRLAALRIRTNIPNTLTKPVQDTSQFTVNFVGKGVPTGKLLITGPLTNGTTLIDKSVCVTDTFWNTGDAALTIDSVAITGANAADFTASYTIPLPFTMAANSIQTFSVCADPADTGTETAVLTGYGTSNESPAIATLALVVYGQSLNDTAVVTQAFPGNCGLDTEVVTVTNTGNVLATYVASISGGTNASDFVVTPISSQEVSGGGTATFTIVFTPSTTSLETTDLIVTGGVTTTIPLSSTGSVAVINGSGTAAVATPSGPVENFTDTLINTGTCTWTPGVPVLPQGSPFAYLNGGMAPIPAGGTGMLTFTFTPPSESGEYSAAVTFPNQTGISIPTANDNVFGVVSSADVASSVFNGFSLEQNYPNPFNEQSNIEITLPVASLVHLTLIDVSGQVVETLLNQHYDAGSFEVTLDATGLASGTYYYQMTAGDVTLTRQMVILK